MEGPLGTTASTALPRAWYGASLAEFLSAEPDAILGRFAASSGFAGRSGAEGGMAIPTWVFGNPPSRPVRLVVSGVLATPNGTLTLPVFGEIERPRLLEWESRNWESRKQKSEGQTLKC